ncbi:hypothetical protein AAG570_003653 [Ranatra chinensis]|uniref:Translational activator of cytochrome c oxidase 1 n=1 Tax=Ranatra chinensis TaxID=642074 RepID=A0ABD0YMA8_9HEMI
MFGVVCTRALPTGFCLVLKRNSGHSKWANIRHIKAQKDLEKSRLFTKMCQGIKIAIKDGGSANPNANLQLAQAIEVAKRSNMPVSSIQNCIKSAQTDQSNTKSVWFEIRGPRGCMLIASALTDNPKKTRETLSSILRKNNASFADHSSKHIFEHKGVINATPPSDLKDHEDACVDHAIECGAEEVVPSDSEDGVYTFICEIENLNSVKSKLEGLKYSIKNADFEFLPNTRVALADQDLEAMSKLLDKLEEHPDIIKIYDNIA